MLVIHWTFVPSIRQSGGMQNPPDSVFVTRIDPRLNMARVYALAIEPAHFSDYAVQRTWGRLGTIGGTIGRTRLDFCADLVSANARKAQLSPSKRERGYVER